MTTKAGTADAWKFEGADPAMYDTPTERRLAAALADARRVLRWAEIELHSTDTVDWLEAHPEEETCDRETFVAFARLRAVGVA